MKKRFEIRYQETYSSTYIVEAESFDMACSLLAEDIRHGRQEGPEECVGCSYSNLMDLVIYQVITDKDRNRVAFMGYDYLPQLQGSEQVDAAIYGKVYEGTVINAADLEDVYRKFNLERPEDFYGRSMSVSDIVGIKDPVTEEVTYYFCDRFGFREVPFDASLAEDM